MSGNQQPGTAAGSEDQAAASRPGGDGRIEYILERKQRFADSVLWQMQRRYFETRGADAWRQGEVPHYVTSNPTIARAYAETVFAFYRDRQRIAPCADALTICELGAGPGRFAFYFLRHLTALCDAAGVAHGAFRYVLTDFTQANLQPWRAHPRFQQWFAEGLLDVALFDVDKTETLQLQVSGAVIGPGSLSHPIVAIANYVFDGVPQDLFYFENGFAHDCLVTLTSDIEPGGSDIAALVASLHPGYDHARLTREPYEDALLQRLLSQYREQYHQAYVVFPAQALRCLQRLRGLSADGLLLLSADKGQAAEDGAVSSKPPMLSRHGSFSLSVNYHAFLAWARAGGGLGLEPADPHSSLAVVALLLTDEAARHAATQDAYRRHVEFFGPDAFYTMLEICHRGIPEMTFDEIVAYMRFNLEDPHQLAKLMPRLMELAPDLDESDVATLHRLLAACWDAYFPLGEESDLAFEIGLLLYELDDFEGALEYFAHSRDIYGAEPSTGYNMAACHQQLGQDDIARTLLQDVLQAMPDNDGARTLLEELK